ncbi:hypothetical protein ACI3KT_16790 [Microbacterium sp. ZW T6_19]|uniref:hypothetical protein n=1 Tax=Microbacterium sp. ZW T6_19 TaxID=3378082 RepID=UPI003852BC4D
MIGTETAPLRTGLTRRAWTRAAGIMPVTAVAVIAGCCLAAAFTSGQVRFVAVAVVILVGVVAGLLWTKHGGVDAVHRRVAAARSAWSGSRDGAASVQDGAADARDVALALPRGWRVEAARGRMRFPLGEVTVRGETWVLRAVVGSRRAPRRREVVGVDAPTDGAFLSIPVGTTADSMLVAPAWAGNTSASAPVWLPTVRDRVAEHEDLLASLTVGDDRVILFALDDPRPETILNRARLVRDVAAIIQAAHGRP